MKYLKKMISQYNIRSVTGFEIILFILVILVTSSCVSQKKLIYLQDKEKKGPTEALEFVRAEVQETIQPGDDLFIRVSSSDERPTSFNTSQNFVVNDVTLLSYTVTDEGFVKLPYIGEIQLVNLSLEEASDNIENTMAQYLYLPSVSVKFVNKNITILGEVRMPGVYTFFDKKISILQAIGYAGDIMTFGNRKEVVLIREENGKIKKNYVDLTKSDILTSDMYTVKSNDIIYVQPLSRKKWGMETYPYNLFITMISSVLMVLTFMRYSYY